MSNCSDATCGKCANVAYAFAFLVNASRDGDHYHGCPLHASGGDETSAVKRPIRDVISAAHPLTEHASAGKKDLPAIRFRVRIIPPNDYAHTKRMGFTSYDRTPDVFKFESFFRSPSSPYGSRNVLQDDSEFGFITLVLEELLSGELFNELLKSVKSKKALLMYGCRTDSRCTLLYANESNLSTVPRLIDRSMPRLAFSLSLDTGNATHSILYGDSLYNTLLGLLRTQSSVLDLMIKVDTFTYAGSKRIDLQPCKTMKVIRVAEKWNVEIIKAEHPQHDMCQGEACKGVMQTDSQYSNESTLACEEEEKDINHHSVEAELNSEREVVEEASASSKKTGKSDRHEINTCIVKIPPGTKGGNESTLACGEEEKDIDHHSVEAELNSEREVDEEASASSNETGKSDRHEINTCIVKIPPGTKAGDVITIRWPTAEQFAKRRRFSINGSSDATSQGTIKSSEESDSQLLVNITMPSNFSTKRKHQFVQVYAPWIAAKCAKNTTLDSRQLRTITINTSARANRGEGNIARRRCPVGNLHQVLVTSIPKAGTWKEGKTRPSDVECEQIWDAARGAASFYEDERIEKYIDSLHPFQKAQYLRTLHQSNYNFNAAKRKMDRNIMQIEVAVDPSQGSETTWQKSDKPCVMLEGAPLSQTEMETFNQAVIDHKKNFSTIAGQVGTTVNRCLVHYYSSFKSSENVGKYLEIKKRWKRSEK